MIIRPFHLAIPVDNLDACRSFYRDILGCVGGRSSGHWVDFDFFGHQLVIHYSESKAMDSNNPVDGRDVPVPHFGVVLAWEQWQAFADQLKKQNIEFIIEPYIRFEHQSGEQATMFFLDPSGNALEFKAFKDIKGLFAK